MPVSLHPALPSVAVRRPGGVAAARAVRLADCLIAAGATMRDALARLDAGTEKICLVTDARRRLLGTVTDGDIRRAILRGCSLATPVHRIMFATPRTVRMETGRQAALAFMRCHGLRHLPVVDFAGRVVDLLRMDGVPVAGVPGAAPCESQPCDSRVVIMAGGQGMRLRPLTLDRPKPMLCVGGRPVLETIVRRCAAAGFDEIFLSVHYRAAVIKAHFGDGRDYGVRIGYLEESTPLGTAGPLGLLPGRDRPAIVINGDILSTVDFRQMLAFHTATGAVATMAVRRHDTDIPYGIVEVDGSRITAIREKPRDTRLVNAGMYVLAPEALATIPPRTPGDMPALFDNLRHAGLPVHAYPVREYWLDIGRMEDYRRARAEFGAVFGP